MAQKTVQSAVRKTVKEQLGGSKRKRRGKHFIRRKIFTRRSCSDFSRVSKMLINGIALSIETSHTLVDSFERPQLLVNFDGSFEQKIVPMFVPNGPTLEFEVKGDRINFID